MRRVPLQVAPPSIRLRRPPRGSAPSVPRAVRRLQTVPGAPSARHEVAAVTRMLHDAELDQWSTDQDGVRVRIARGRRSGPHFNCFGLDDHQDGFPVAPHAPRPDPEDSISGRQFQPFGSRPPQDCELLPQGEVFQSGLHTWLTP